MRIRKKHLKYLYCAIIFFLFCSFTAQAQPTCFSNFDVRQTCNWDYQLKEFVFFGRVAAVATEAVSDEHYNGYLKVVVEIEESLKGGLSGGTEVFLEQNCFGQVLKDERYIFTAERFTGGNLSGIFSKKWSKPFRDDNSKSDIEEVFAKVRSVVKKDRQPRLSGTAMQFDWIPFFHHLTFGGKTIFAHDPRQARPLANFVVIAKSKFNKEFKTETDANGYFEFNDLPGGEYEIHANPTTAFNIIVTGDVSLGEANKVFVEINDLFCGKSVILNAQLQGKIKVRGINIMGGSSRISFLRLIRVEKRLEQKELYDFIDSVRNNTSLPDDKSNFDYYSSFEEVPFGSYILAASIKPDPTKPETVVYYPGTFDLEKAGIINVETGKPLNIELNLPYLPGN